ncbi:MAG: response regulator [Bacteroidaceae bacterium]|nr:response regulator [Bacteroidaceae bacterium]
MKAQNVQFFNSKQGLSNTCIYAIYEDSRNNIWITTQNGLNRYDGVKINVYRHDDADEHSLCHDDVVSVFEYDRNHLLVGTGRGMQVYDYATDDFSPVYLLGYEGDTIYPRVIDFYRFKENGKERVMVTFSGYGNGEIYKDEHGKLAARHTRDYNTGDNFYNPIQFMEDKRGRLWIVNGHQDVFRRQGKGFKAYPEVSAAVKLREDEKGNIFLATDTRGIFRYDAKADRFVCVASAEQLGGVVFSFKPWTDGRYFVCTDGGGLRVYNATTQTVTQSAIRVNDFNIATSNVKDALVDKFGNVWVGIYWKGVMMKPSTKTPFEYVGRHSITKNSIGTNSAFAMAEAEDGNIWVAVDNDGLYLMSPDGTSSSHWNTPESPNAPAAFTSICPLGGGKVLLGTFFDGLWQMDNGRLSLVTKDINHIFEIKPADNGCYWISTIGSGFFYYNPVTRTLKDSFHSAGDAAGNPFDYTVLQIKDKLYVGSADGMVICGIKGHGVLTKERYKLLGGHAVKHFAASPDGKYVWVASNRGLYRVEIASRKTKRYAVADGLSNNSVESLYAEGDFLWIGTDYGMTCMNTKNGTFKCFYADDGLQDNEFCRGSVLSSGCNLYFGGISGITYFNTSTICKSLDEATPMQLSFVDLIVSGKSIHVGDMSGSYNIIDNVIDDVKRVELCNTDNHFILELRVAELGHQHVTYEYSLDGKTWISQGVNGNQLVFSNLQPGVYRLRVRAVSYGSVSDERELEVIVHPAWYASNVAIFVYCLLFLVFCWLAYLYVSRQVRARKVIARHRQQQELNEARVQFFMNISHEIRTPMTLIFSPLEKLMSMDKDEEHQKNYKLIKHNSNRILRLVNQMMDVRKIEKGQFLLTYRRVDLVALLQNIFDVFVSNASGRNITYSFQHSVDALSVVVDPDNMDKIVMNLLSNAFKFTPDGGNITLNLDASHTDEQFTLSVTDSGCGIKDEDKNRVFERFYSAGNKNGYIGTGIGLNLTYMLVRLHKGTISVADNPNGSGASFIINMPFGTDDLLSQQAVVAPVVEMPEEDAAAESDTSEDRAAELRRKNVVIVEDDEDIRQYVVSELKQDFSITEFSNGQQALDYVLAHHDKVGLVISDVMMPAMDGMNLCQRLKSNINTNHIPVILMTALGSDADRILGLTNGADAYVTKPFNIEVLRTTAMSILKTRQLILGKFTLDKQKELYVEQRDVESPDENLMKRIMKVISDNMDNPELSVEIIADKVGISRVHFYRKMKDLTGQAPRDFVKYVRLKEAARLLKEKKLDITGASVATGFKSLSAFSTNFKSLFGLSPSEWVKMQNQKEAEGDDKGDEEG